jgi:hypothetical protein
MIEIKLLEGPFAEETRTMPRNKTPVSIFASFIQMDWRWKTDYSQSTSEEFVAWFRIELVAKIAFSFKRRIPVYFLGKKYLPPVRMNDDYAEDIQNLEEIICRSGRLIILGQDDEKKLVIKTVGYESDRKEMKHGE